MLTEQLLQCLPLKKVIGEIPRSISDLTADSRSVQPNSMFVCVGNGHRFAQAAVNQGATVIITEKELSLDGPYTAQIIVDDTSKALGLLAAKYYNYPSKDLDMFGITGTNGKSSVAGIIQNILRGLETKCALVGTIGFDINGTLYETANTTNDALTTQQMISQAKKEGCQSMIMEVSSHGLVLGRVAGVEFDVAIFTNLSHDHLDFHGTMENYGYAKGILFSQLGQDLQKEKHAILNADDMWSDRYKELTPYPVWTYALKSEAHFRATECTYSTEKTTFTMETPEGTFPVEMSLIGEFNVYNVLAATAALYAKGYPLAPILQQLQTIPGVKGRMEQVQTDLPITMYVDYAHSPDAIEKAIESVASYKENKLIFLIGTGGNRDKSKRPIMAEKASEADYVILTTDDPRNEPFDSILSDLEKGMKHQNYACIGDRAEAVRHAIAVASPGDIIIFAGKGHEDFQIVENTKYPHSDADIALDAAQQKFQKQR